MRLSVCMIVRNEAARLSRALESVRDIADELVIADTGSTDNTIEIAGSFGARVLDFPWIEDFGAAINHVVAEAQGEWVLRIDADEWLLPESGETLRACLDRDDVFAWMLRRRDLKFEDRLDVYSEMWVDRLFRRRPGLRLVGRCHAQPEAPWESLAAAEGRKVLTSDVVLLHTGYVGEQRESKLRRAAKLLQLELRDRPGQLYYQVELGNTLLLLGDPHGHAAMREALETIAKSAGDPVAPSPSAILALQYLLIPDPNRPPMPLNADDARGLSPRWFPRCVQLHWSAALHAFSQNDFASAAGSLERIVSLKNEDDYDRTVSFDPRIMGDDLLLNLGACYVRLARLADAERCFRQLLPTPAADAARQNLKVIAELRAMA